MKWTIRVRPVDVSLSSWKWTAERADGETTASGGGSTQGMAVENARAEVREREAAFTIVEENSLTEEYTPTEAEILAAFPPIEAPKMPMLRLEPS